METPAAKYHPDDLVSVRAVSAATDMSERTYNRYRALGIGPPYIRLGPRKIRYRWGDVMEWLDRRRVEPVRERGVA